MPALLSESMTRRRLPTFMARAWVLSSWAWPSVMANSPSKAMILGRHAGAPTISQNAALPAAQAMPTPDGPPFTSLVTSMLSACPARALMPRAFGLREQRDDPPGRSPAGWSSSAPAPRRNPSASMGSMATLGST